MLSMRRPEAGASNEGGYAPPLEQGEQIHMKCARKSRKYRLAQLKFLALLTAFGFLAGCGSDLGTGLTTDTSTGTTTTDSTDTTTDEVLARRGDGGSQQSPRNPTGNPLDEL